MGVQIELGQVTLYEIDTGEEVCSFDKGAVIYGGISYYSPKMIEDIFGIKLKWHQKLSLYVRSRLLK